MQFFSSRSRNNSRGILLRADRRDSHAHARDLDHTRTQEMRLPRLDAG